MRTVRYERPVHYYETDKMGCVHHSNYIRWFEEARARLMEEGGFGYDGMERAGICSPVLTVEAEYKSMTRFGETVLVEARMERYTGTRIVWSYTVRDRDAGTVRCVGKTSHCFLNGQGRPVSLKKALPEYDEIIRRAMEEE